VLISPTNQLPTISNLEDNGYIFRSCAPATVQIPIVTRWFLDQGWTRMFLIHQDDAYGNGLRGSFLETFSAGGGEVELFSYKMTDDNFAENAVSSARASFAPEGPDVIEMAGFVEDGAVIIETAASAWQKPGAPQWVVFNGMKRPEFVRQIGGVERAVGLMGSSFTDANNQDSQAFQASFAALYGNDPYDFSWNAYDAVYLAAIAMALSDDPEDGTQIRDNLMNTSSGKPVHPGEWARVLELLPEGKMDYQGASGPVDFDANGDVLQRVSTWMISPDGTYVSQCWEPSGIPCQ
jgi:branched-chain amino acid transport system substrate-binding protein